MHHQSQLIGVYFLSNSLLLNNVYVYVCVSGCVHVCVCACVLHVCVCIWGEQGIELCMYIFGSRHPALQTRNVFCWPIVMDGLLGGAS